MQDFCTGAHFTTLLPIFECSKHMAREYKHIPNDRQEREEFLYRMFVEIRPYQPSPKATCREISRRIGEELKLRALEMLCTKNEWQKQYDMIGAPDDVSKDPAIREIVPAVFSAMGHSVQEIGIPIRPKNPDLYTHEEKRATLKNIFHYWVQGRYHMDALCNHHGLQYHEIMTWCNDDNDLFEMLERAERATTLRRNMLFREGAYLRLIEQFEKPTYEEINKEYVKEITTDEAGNQQEVWKEVGMKISVKRNKPDAGAMSWAVLLARQLEAVSVTRPLNSVERVDQMSFEELEAKEKELLATIRDKTKVRDQLLSDNSTPREQVEEGGDVE